MSSTCLPSAKRNTDLEDVYVTEYLKLDDQLGNKIVGSKYCSESKDYQFIYQLDNGMWVASNNTWVIGERVMLMPVKNDTVHGKE